MFTSSFVGFVSADPWHWPATCLVIEGWTPHAMSLLEHRIRPGRLGCYSRRYISPKLTNRSGPELAEEGSCKSLW